MSVSRQFLEEHQELTRRYFLRLGAAGLAAAGFSPAVFAAEPNEALKQALAELKYLTKPDDFVSVERGKPLPYTLPPETWRENNA